MTKWDVKGDGEMTGARYPRLPWQGRPIAALLLVAVIALLKWDQCGDRRALSLAFRLRPAPELSSPVTVMVVRGERAETGSLLRAEIAAVLRDLERWQVKPRAVVVDALLSLLEPVDDAERVVNATVELKRVVHGMQMSARSAGMTSGVDLRPFRRLTLPDDQGWPEADGLKTAHPSFAQRLYDAAAGVGHGNLSVTKGAGAVPLLYRYAPGGNGEARLYPALSLAGAAVALCPSKVLEACFTARERQLLGPGFRIPLTAEGEYLVNYRRRFLQTLPPVAEGASSGNVPDLVMYHSSALLTAQRSPEQAIGWSPPLVDATQIGWLSLSDGKTEVEPSLLSSQILLIVDGMEPQVQRTPLGSISPLSSVHAQIMSNIVEQDFLRVLPELAVWPLVLVLILTSVLLHRRWPVSLSLPAGRGKRWLFLTLRPGPSLVAWGSGAHELGLAGAYVLSAATFFAFNIVLPFTLPLSALLGSLVGGWLVIPLQVKLGAKKTFQLRCELDAKLRAIETLTHQLQEVRLVAQARESELTHKKQLEMQLAEVERRLAVQEEALRVQEARDRQWERDKLDMEDLLAQQRQLRSDLDERNRGLEDARHELECLRTAFNGDDFDALISSTESIAALAKTLERAERCLNDRLEQVSGNGARTNLSSASAKSSTAELDRLMAEVGALRPQIGQGQLNVRIYHDYLVVAYQTSLDLVNRANRRLGDISDYLGRSVSVITKSGSHEVAPMERYGILTADAAMKWLLEDTIPKYAATGLPVLIQGETGTGKELFSKAIWQLSSRNDKIMVPCHIGALAKELVQSELFGHVRGAFTGALKDKEGFLQKANHGTLHLDEIGELSLSVQVLLLRFLEIGEVYAVGDRNVQHLDVRVVASTHRDLEAAVRAGEFRLDLFHRLNVLKITIPPLRERPWDIPVLAEAFLRRSANYRGQVLTLGAREVLLHHAFPGNVREIRSTMERVLVQLAASSTAISAADIATALRSFIPIQLPANEDLEVFRAHRFDYDATAAALGVGRKAAERRLRILMASSLWHSAWRVHVAASLLAGQALATIEPLLRKRILIFLSNLSQRPGEKGGDKDLTDYGASAESVQRVVTALQGKRIVQSEADEPPLEGEALARALERERKALRDGED